MSKRNKIIYWISTIWLALGMASTGFVQLIKDKEEIDFIMGLNYPDYILPILGVWKILGAIVILLPALPLLKEWAYAGFFFVMSGAIFSHIAVSDELTAILPSLFLLSLTIVSWFFRPRERRLETLPKKQYNES